MTSERNSGSDPEFQLGSLARLLQLASPALPVGAYSYSQGLEAAVEAGIVSDAQSAEHWIGDMLALVIERFEAPVLWRMMHGESLNELFLASRETAELRAETAQMGESLRALLLQLGVQGIPDGEIAFPSAFAAAVRAWKIEPRAALIAYLWSWLENQVMAAMKAMPLGQTTGQKMLLRRGAELERIADEVPARAELLNFAPGLALLSSRHETQYSRLFRS